MPTPSQLAHAGAAAAGIGWCQQTRSGPYCPCRQTQAPGNHVTTAAKHVPSISTCTPGADEALATCSTCHKKAFKKAQGL